VIQFLLLGLVVLAGAAGPTYTGPYAAAARAAGLALVVAGLVLAAWGLLDLRDALTPLPHPRDGAELVDTGSYRLVRHPIYGGIVLGSTGYALVVGSPLALAGTAILLAFFRLKSGREEAWLREHYPAYQAYATRTKRMIPWIY
jgi:protein-S-isoprenylcysteine O-methyltransferase Ste14